MLDVLLPGDAAPALLPPMRRCSVLGVHSLQHVNLHGHPRVHRMVWQAQAPLPRGFMLPQARHQDHEVHLLRHWNHEG